MSSLALIKLLYALAILAVSLAGLKLAASLRQRPGSGQGLANAFAAGIFLGTGLLHFGVEARNGWTALGASYPLAELLALAAFLGLLFVEHVALSDTAHAAVHAHSGGSHHHHDGPVGKDLGILLALSLHSFVAGLALGVAGTATRASLAAAAILAHKLTEGFALGTVLAGDTAPERRRRAGWVFAIATPLGILLGGLALQPFSGDGGLFTPIVASLAAGTFLYIGAFDLLQDEFVEPGGRVGKWLLACLGVGVSALLASSV